MELSSSLEDYLEAIYNCVKEKGEAKVTDVAKALNVKKASVTGALVNLYNKKLINYQPYMPINLTSEGKKAAEKIIEKHKVITEFLINILSLDKDEAAENACKMEHIMSETMFQRIMKFSMYMQDLFKNDEKIRQSLQSLYK